VEHNPNVLLTGWQYNTDEQLGQLYELMKAIQKRGTEGDSTER